MEMGDSMTELDQKIRDEFPVLRDRETVYLDNGATSQKPQCVIDAVQHYYEHYNANPMRGLYDISVEATDAYEESRRVVADFIHAAKPEEIIYTRNTTESMNLLAYSYGQKFLGEGDEIIVAVTEHHSNFLPWKEVATRNGAKIVWFDCEQDGELKPEKLQELVNEHTKLVAVTQLSNVIGRINDVKKFAEIAHSVGAVIVVDGAQSVPHMPVDVQDLDVDFLAFSGHKMFAPMGIGVLYGKMEHLKAMPPFFYGGEMIEYVFKDRVKYSDVPHKFEAGTVNVGGAIGLMEAIKFIQRYGWDVIMEREDDITRYAMEKIAKITHVHVIGSQKPEEHHGLITFTIDDVHPHDIAAIFDSAHVAVRAGHHCAQPLHKHLGLFSTTRVSFAFYNNHDDIDAFIDCLSKIRGLMGYTD
jgi:cysteine desulfurase/selenocysteine lyase